MNVLAITHLDRTKEAELTSVRVVERPVPLVQRLEAVHHGAIVAVGRRRDQEEDDPPIEGDESLGVSPCKIRGEEVVKTALVDVGNSTGAHGSIDHRGVDAMAKEQGPAHASPLYCRQPRMNAFSSGAAC
jgi:hypothetical protein